MLTVDRVRDIAQEMAKSAEYVAEIWEVDETSGAWSTVVKPKQVKSVADDVSTFHEKAVLEHKELLVLSEGDLPHVLRPALRALVRRTECAFMGCTEVEFLGESMYGAEARVGPTGTELVVLFYSYSAGIRTVRVRVMEENV